MHFYHTYRFVRNMQQFGIIACSCAAKNFIKAVLMQLKSELHSLGGIHAYFKVVNMSVMLLQLFRHSTKALLLKKSALLLPPPLPHTKTVRLHALQAKVVIPTPKTTDLNCYLSSSQSRLVGSSIQVRAIQK